jgi:hypothetical protein
MLSKTVLQSSRSQTTSFKKVNNSSTIPSSTNSDRRPDAATRLGPPPQHHHVPVPPAKDSALLPSFYPGRSPFRLNRATEAAVLRSSPGSFPAPPRWVRRPTFDRQLALAGGCSELCAHEDSSLQTLGFLALDHKISWLWNDARRGWAFRRRRTRRRLSCPSSTTRHHRDAS